MKKTKKKKKDWTFKDRFQNLDKYKTYVNKQRKELSTWQLMLQHPTKDWVEIDGDYQRIQTLCNLAYILADIQDWCFMDVKDILRHYNMKAKFEAKQNFAMLKKNISAVCYCLDQCSRRVNNEKGAKDFVAGMSDLLYQTSLMLFDRMHNKRDVIHFIHLLRSIPNYNQIFPELDKGRYIFNK